MTSIGPIALRPETGPMDEMSIDELRLLVQRLETEDAAMRPIVLRVVDARMRRDAITMVESRPH